MNEHHCRVCGWYMDDLSWGDDGSSPIYEICPCCGVEFGNEDYTLESVRLYRQKWINSGAKWFFSKEKPEEWSLEKQLENISSGWM